MKYYILEQQDTVASAVRTALERASEERAFVACTRLHPLDDHLEIEAPSEQMVRHALLDVKSGLARARLEAHKKPSRK